MKYVSYGRAVLVNLITLLIILSIISATYSKFEGIIVGILIMIYLNVNAFFTLYSRNTLLSSFVVYNLFKDLKEQLNLEINKDDEELVDEVARKLEKENGQFYINMGFFFLFYIIVLFSLLGSLYS